MQKLKYYFNRFILRKTRDRRRYLRKPLSLKVTNQQSGFFTYYVSIDISAGGMFLRAEEPLPVGTRLDLEFNLPGDDIAVRTAAEVVRIVAPSLDLERPSGMGIRFLDITKEQRKDIEKFVNQTL